MLNVMTTNYAPNMRRKLIQNKNAVQSISSVSVSVSMSVTHFLNLCMNPGGCPHTSVFTSTSCGLLTIPAVPCLVQPVLAICHCMPQTGELQAGCRGPCGLLLVEGMQHSRAGYQCAE